MVSQDYPQISSVTGPAPLNYKLQEFLTKRKLTHADIIGPQGIPLFSYYEATKKKYKSRPASPVEQYSFNPDATDGAAAPPPPKNDNGTEYTPDGVRIPYFRMNKGRVFEENDSRYNKGVFRTRLSKPRPQFKRNEKGDYITDAKGQKVPELDAYGNQRFAKYHTNKGGGSYAYFNGLVRYFPTVNIFEHIIITEGEIKAFTAAKYGIECVGFSGIHNMAKAIKEDPKDTDSKTIDASFRPDFLEFIKTFGVKTITLLHDTDALQNTKNGISNILRAKQFFAAVRNVFWACEKVGVKLRYAVGITDHAKGLDDLINTRSKLADRQAIADQCKLELLTPNLTNKDRKYFVVYNVNQYTLKRVIKPLFANSTAQHKPIKITIKQVQKYLSEIVGELEKWIHKGKDFVLSAPTGIGKNYTLYKLLMHLFPNKRFIVCYPTNLANEAQTNEYKSDVKILKIDQTTPKEIKANLSEHYEAAQVVNICYHSFDYIKDMITENDVIICDEAHKLITNSEIMQDIAPQIDAIFTSPAQKIFISGTHFESFINEYSLPVLEVNRLQNANTNINCIELIDNKAYDKKQRKILKQIDRLNTRLVKEKDLIKKKQLKVKIKTKDRELLKAQSFNPTGEYNLYYQAALNYVSSIKKEGTPKIWPIFLNHKSNIDKVAAYAKNKGLDVEIVYKDSKVMNSEIWDYLTGNIKDANGNAIPIPIGVNHKIILFTSVAYESINILNTNISNIAIFGEKSIENVIQAISRFRKLDYINVDYFLTATGDKDVYYADYAQHRKKWVKDFDKATSIIGQYDKMELAVLKDSERKNLLCDVSYTLNYKGEFDTLKCVTEYEKDRIKCSNTAQRFSLVSNDYNTTITRLDVKDVYKVHSNELTEIEKEQATAAASLIAEKVEIEKEQAKENKEANTEKVKALLTENIYYCFAFLVAGRTDLDPAKNKAIRKILGQNFSFFDDDFLIFCEKVKELDRSGMQLLKKYAFRLLGLINHFSINTDLVELAFSKDYNHVRRQLNNIERFTNDSSKDVKTIVNFEQYEKLCAAINEARQESNIISYAILRDLAKASFSEWEKEFKPSQYLKLIRSLYSYTEHNANGVRSLELHNIITLNDICNKYKINSISVYISIAA